MFDILAKAGLRWQRQIHGRMGTAGMGANFDAIVVGAGFAGLYMLHRLRELGLSAVVVEAGSDVGGTWYWNRYPGARCDVESISYSYSFSPELEQEWTWSERFPTQPEVLSYIQHVADRFDLRRDIRFNERVTSVTLTGDRWTATTDAGQTYEATFFIAASGCLSVPNVPRIEGLEEFEGPVYHTGDWPAEPVDLRGQRVGVIGTGSSGIQTIPVIAQEAGHLYVFQRTANFSVPARNAPLDPAFVAEVKASYPRLREDARNSPGGHMLVYGETPALSVPEAERLAAYEENWQIGGPGLLLVYSDLRTAPEANEGLADFVRDKIRATVRDPKVAELLCPSDHPIGAKRVCVDTDYYETFNRDNVTLVDVRATPIVRLTGAGLETTDQLFELDCLVLASGFDAMTGALTRMNIVGRDGQSLTETWANGPREHLGLAIPGFPNLFTITGPGSPSVLSNVVLSIEQHVDWIADCLVYMRERGYTRVEATPEAEQAWHDEVMEAASHTLFVQANSWYLGSNVPGKPRVFMPYAGGVGAYRARCAQIAADGYPGFEFG
jgi:cation diffusion facilitator CzcD-associated flavoprotein CzcO